MDNNDMNCRCYALDAINAEEGEAAAKFLFKFKDD